jgi:flagellar biosynthesis/type III secretory pathway protein FliH
VKPWSAELLAAVKESMPECSEKEQAALYEMISDWLADEYQRGKEDGWLDGQEAAYAIGYEALRSYE